ncbi:hypothetical protein DL764_006010 [Monosporascus ibericus]|uniref:Homeobox domain-containing protein n=1 Tax=Monosporascus ibericus TaxID=155417 RepID=A0A4Q4T6G5_9PEZI|nr:hypothetical protein DL764_006010 [Monosporascus ibericus]
MLVTRQCESEQNPWSSRFEALFNKATSPRMSSFSGPLSTQPDWHGLYSFLPQGENNVFAQSFEPIAGSTTNSNATAQQRQESEQEDAPGGQNRPSLDGPASDTGDSRTLDPLGPRRPKVESPSQKSAETRDSTYSIKAEPAQDDTLASTDTPGLARGPNPRESAIAAERGQVISTNQGGNENAVVEKEEDDDVLEDDEMVEAEGEQPCRPQTAAERTAARRKMKRFRLTHQQTRFLMSEFAKQPHPDAAHRERLSREIPGLSPRQVQVWFQNRRAKIKRLTADDRDRMIKMRAVPDDFDNVQALHSPYGAVHALGTPLSSPAEFNNSPYSDHLMRPLMVDTVRRGGDDHMSPTALNPSFGGIGFTPSGAMGKNLQSPLRSSMSWKGDSIDYSSYASSSEVSSIPGRYQSVYQPEHMGNNAGGGLSYESDSYSSAGLQSSPTNINYSSVQAPTLQQPQHNRSRLRAASANLPLGLDLRHHQYRPGHGLQPSNHSSTPRAASTSPYGNPNTYTTGYPSAPLTAPVDFSLPRTPSVRTSVPDYSPPQMSAPIAPPQDFTAALHGNMGSPHARTPMRDSFGGGPLR